MTRMGSMAKQDVVVFEEIPEGREFDAEYLYTIRRDRKAWNYRKPRKGDPFQASEVVRQVPWCGQSGVEIDWMYWPSIGKAEEEPTPGVLTTLTVVHRVHAKLDRKRV
eukprot:4798058-Amphidinium_carterae.1